MYLELKTFYANVFIYMRKKDEALNFKEIDTHLPNNKRIDAYKGKKMCKVYENHTNTNLSQRLGLKLVLYVQRIVMI